LKRETGLGIGLIVLLIAVLYCWTMVSASGGRPVAPLDDAYIHFQYARQIARGHLWQYNDGDPRSTGATSPLYPFLLAAGYRLGFEGEYLVWFALGLGIASLAASVWLIYRLTGRLSRRSLDPEVWVTRWVPLGTAVVFLLTGAIQWTYMSGMESGLFTAFALAALDAFLAGSASPNKRLLSQVTFWIALAALTRPGGLILVGVLWPVVVARSWHRKRSSGWQTQVLTIAKRTWPITLAVLASLLPFLLNLTLTGSAVATGAQAKSWLGNVPFRFWDILGSIFGNYRRIMEQFAAGLLAQDPWLLAPGLLVLAGIGWMALLRRQRWATFTLTIGWFTLGVLATASLITATWQMGRYQVPFLALLTPLAGLGFAALISGLPRRWQSPSAAMIALGLLAATLASSLQARSTYQQAIRTISKQHLVVADWIRDNLPSDARVGVHDTGAIRYVGQRPTYDMIGLTTQSAATAWRHGAGAVFERMEHSPARPDHFATYPDVFSLPYLAATDIFAVELFRAEVPDFVVASAGPVQAVYRADWRLAGSGDRLYQADVLRRTEGLTLLDRLDLADLEDEAAHDLSFWEGTVRSGFPTEVQQYRYRTDATIEVLDGGRLVNGGLAFRVAVRPGQPVLLTARLHPAQAGAVRVIIDDHDLGLWRYPAQPGAWLETAFFIPAAALTQDRPEIHLQVETADPAFRHFALYHLWVWGGEPTPFEPNPTHRLSARLGDAVELIGYDQSTGQLANQPTLYQPGETIQLVLYWRAVAKPTDDAKVFVHLYNQEGETVTQRDHRPYRGTRPPLTWSPGETLEDPYTLVLPSELPPGRYTLAVGMYDATTGVRLPITVATEHQLSDNRILLGTFEVVSGMESP
jgi:hypothetical protein